MNVGSMCDYIAFLVDDIAFGYFKKPQLYRFLNQAGGECQKKLIDAGALWYLKVTPDSGGSSIPLVVNQGSYAQPSDTMEVNRIELVQNPGTYENRYSLTSCTLNQKDLFPQGPGQPLAFYLGKNTIEILPPPNAVAGQILRVFYNYRIVEINQDSDTMDVPIEYQEYVCLLAARKCYLKDGRDASLLNKDIEEVESRMMRKAMERAKDQPRQVVVTGEGGGFGGFY